MESERVTIRLPKPLADAARKAAGEDTISTWLRRLVERETGISAGEMRPGLGSVSERKRKQISGLGHAARRAKKKSQK